VNEKIRQLMMEAGEYANSVWVDPITNKEDHISWHDLYNEKFAELIIKDCAKNCLGIVSSGGDLDFAIWKIKKEYGIEE
jgi:hypothetical protein